MRLRWLTLPRLTLAITFLAVLAMAARPAVDTDTWWHLRVGEWILTQRAVPQTDVFSHTRFGQPWRYPSSGWLAEIILYALYHWLGYFGLNLFTAAAAVAAFLFIERTCRGPALLRAFTLVLAAAAAAIFWSARPQMASFTLTAVFAYVLHRWRWEPAFGRRVWILPPLMALWANLHGGFALGFVLIALTLAGQAAALAGRLVLSRAWADGGRAFLRQDNPPPGDVNWRGCLTLAGLGLVCAAAACLNPSGPVLLTFPFQTVNITVLRDYIQEWQSPDFQVLAAQPFLWLLLATLAALGLSRRRISLTDLALVAGLAYAGFLAWRNVALLAIVAPPVLTRHAADALEDGWPSPAVRAAPAWSGWLNAGLLLVLALVTLMKVASDALPAVNAAQVARVSPVGAADYLRRVQPPGPLFNSYNFGGYLAWRLYPDYLVFVDGRTDLYPDDFLRAYLRVWLAQPGYEAELERYGIRVVVVEAESPLHQALARTPGWQLGYADARAAVWLRSVP